MNYVAQFFFQKNTIDLQHYDLEKDFSIEVPMKRRQKQKWILLGILTEDTKICNTSCHRHFYCLIHSVKNEVLERLKSFFQLNHQVDSSLYLIEAITLRHSRELASLKPPWFLLDAYTLIPLDQFGSSLSQWAIMNHKERHFLFHNWSWNAKNTCCQSEDSLSLQTIT